MKENQVNIEQIGIEAESYSDDSLFNITSYGIDLSFREIMNMYKEGDLEKPEMQRKYVWDKKEASRFIDSILLGLPIPSIFLAKTSNEKRLIVDGYQRIMTVYDYVDRGIFGGDSTLFRLSNTEDINERWRGKSYKELNEDEQRKIRTSSIHAIVFEQTHPKDDSGMYQIFERINTSGRPLKPQEIRNCVYHGDLNQLLLTLNKIQAWRNLLNNQIEDSRMMDVELILRSFAIGYIKENVDPEQKRIVLVKYLNDFMRKYKDLTPAFSSRITNEFTIATAYLYEHIGINTFRGVSSRNPQNGYTKKINPAIVDSILGATYYMIDRNFTLPNKPLIEEHLRLVNNPEYQTAISIKTTDIDTSIKKRITIAAQILFGVEYDWAI